MPLTASEIDFRIDTLLRADDFGLARWEPAFGDAPLVLSYRFETAAAPDFPWDNVAAPVAFSEDYKSAVRLALDRFERVLNLTFVEDNGPDDAEISFYRSPDLYTDSALLGGGRGRNQFQWRTTSGVTTYEWDGHVVVRDVYDLTLPQHFDLLVHEIGHALGLKHPGDYDVSAVNAPPGPFLPENEDNTTRTIMSYNAAPGHDLEPDDLMLYDVGALQKWWGINGDETAGPTIHRAFADPALKVVWDSGGRDEVRHDGDAPLQVDLREGHFSTMGGQAVVAIAFDTVIEVARLGGGADRVVGNDAANRLIGAGGGDTLKGGAGSDVLIGNRGADRLIGGPGRDRLEGGPGRDRLDGGAAADTFVFGPKSGKDRIVDFTDNQDTIELDAALWTGKMTPKAVIAEFAEVVGDAIVFDFGSQTLRLKRFTDMEALENDIDIV